VSNFNFNYYIIHIISMCFSTKKTMINQMVDSQVME